MRLSIVIPCYNEAKNIPFLIERSKRILERKDCELILVNNGSTDETEKVLKKFNNKYPNCRILKLNNNKGYGFGILSGLKEANGDIIGWTHADMQTDPLDVLKGFNLFKKHGRDIFVKGKRIKRPFSDNFFTIGMSVFESFLLFKPLWDINAQPTMFSKDFFQIWKEPPHDFSLDLYSYYVAKKNNIKIFKFPVLFGKRYHGTSSWNIDLNSKIKFIKRTINYSLLLRKNLIK